MSGGQGLRINLKSSGYLVFFLITSTSHQELTGLLSRATSCSRPGRKVPVVCPAQQTLHLLARGWVMEALPSCLSFPSPPWCRFCAFVAGIWKLFLFTQHRQDAAACCAPANRNLGFPAGSFQRLHAKQPAVLQGASGPCYISVEEVLPSVQTGHPGLSACPLDGQLPSYLESECFCYCCFIF